MSNTLGSLFSSAGGFGKSIIDQGSKKLETAGLMGTIGEGFEQGTKMQEETAKMSREMEAKNIANKAMKKGMDNAESYI